MFSKVMIVAVAGLAAATPAYAQDAEATALTYSGPRAELRAGMEWLSGGVQSDQEFDGRGEFGDDAGGEGPFAGVEVGFDHAVGSSFVVGAYAGLEISDTDIEPIGNRPYRFSTGRNFTLGVRAGVPLSRGAMIYAKGGYSNGKLKPEFLDGANEALFDNFKSGRSGFHLGGGAEIPFLTNTYARIEYVYTGYKTYELDDTLELPFHRHQIAAAVGMRF